MKFRLLVIGLLALAVARGIGAAETSSIVARHEVAVEVQGHPFKLWLMIFDPVRCAVRVIDNPHRQGAWRFASLPEAMQAARCIAGVNGSFYRPEANPIVPAGLAISEGRQVMPLDRESWMRGVFVVRAEGLALQRTEDFREDPRITAALQAGPWLVREAQAATDLDRKRVAKRTFVAQGANGSWAFGTAEECSLRELAAALRHPRAQAVLEITTALNLDGGPSTGLWQKEANGAFYQREGGPVSNYIGLAPKP